MVYLNYSILQMTCAECGFLSKEIEDFVNLVDGMLCHACYDNAVHLTDEEARKGRALSDAINTDYFD